ncbi:MAG: hypothetical protein ACLPPF_19305 [Rhodomicrobium sp.]
MAACQLPRSGKRIFGTVISSQLGFQALVDGKVLFAARRGHDAGHNQQGSQDAFARDRFAQPLSRTFYDGGASPLHRVRRVFPVALA